jgi:hypothetical protein
LIGVGEPLRSCHGIERQSDRRHLRGLGGLRATVRRWGCDPLESRGAKTASAVGQAVAGAVLPRFLSKGASAAISASIESSTRLPRGVRVEWSDGKPPSLLKLPEDLFAHFELLLGDLRVQIAHEPVAEETTVAVVTTSAAATDAPQTMAEQAFSMVSGLIKDRTRTAADTAAPPRPDVAEQLLQLASLRDAGVLSETEFAAKKTELLARM